MIDVLQGGSTTFMRESLEPWLEVGYGVRNRRLPLFTGPQRELNSRTSMSIELYLSEIAPPSITRDVCA